MVVVEEVVLSGAVEVTGDAAVVELRLDRMDLTVGVAVPDEVADRLEYVRRCVLVKEMSSSTEEPSEAKMPLWRSSELVEDRPSGSDLMRR